MTTSSSRPQVRRTSTTSRVRGAATSTSTASTPRAPRRRRTARKGPSVVLTAEGVAGLREYIVRLRTELDDMREFLGEPRRDERLVHDAERLFAEIDAFEGLLAQADTMDEAEVLASPVIRLGSRVELTFDDGTREIVRLVHPSEAFLDDERVSIESPLAKVLLGLSVGDRTQVKAPAGSMSVHVDAVGAGIEPRVAAATV